MTQKRNLQSPLQLCTETLKHGGLLPGKGIVARLITAGQMRKHRSYLQLRHSPQVRQQLTGLLLKKTEDRKSTRLNSSHVRISYAVFCLKKKKSRAPVDLST